MKATESSKKRSEAKQEDKLWTAKQLQKDPSGRNLVGFFDLGKVKSYYWRKGVEGNLKKLNINKNFTTTLL